MRGHHRNATVLIVVFLIAGCTSGVTPAPTDAPQPSAETPIAPPTLQDAFPLTVLGVKDGRTVLLSNGSEILIEGLAAPEECWAAAATAFAKAFLLDKPVRIEPANEALVDKSPLWLADGTDYALLAIRQGVLRGDAKHDPAFTEAEASAVKAELGLWGAPCRGQAAPPSQTAPPPPATAPAQPPAPVTHGCSVTYRVTHRWPNGFRTDVTIANTGNAPISGWTLHWTFAAGQTVTEMWNATAQQSSAGVNATNVSYSAVIPAGGSQLIGFTASHRAANPDPSGFTLNGRMCTVKS